MSGQLNNLFMGDPDTFVAGHDMSFDNLFDTQVFGQTIIARKWGIFDFVATVGSGVQVKCVADDTWFVVDSAIKAYYCPYKSVSMIGGDGDVPYVDIPKQNPDIKFVFTGGLTGCSVIVVDYSGGTYRVYHDSRPDIGAGKVTYQTKNIVAKVEFASYKYSLGGRDTGNAVAMLYYVNNKWRFTAQKQTMTGPASYARSGVTSVILGA